MRQILRYIFIICLMLVSASCDFLSPPPGVDITEDDVFSSKTNVETQLASIYQRGMHSNLGYGNDDQKGGKDTTNPHLCPWSGRSDESEQCAPWYEPNTWNAGAVSPDNTDDERWKMRWEAIRMITVMLKRADEVPDITHAYAAQLKAECRVIRALNYLELLKFYGGVPIIREYIDVNSDLKRPRNSINDVVEFIVEECDLAVPDLPGRQLGVNRGRVDQGAAYAIKSKALLYAASPLFNTDTPYLDFGSNNDLICYGDYDETRWERAAAAAWDCLKWAEANGCILIEDQGVEENHRYSWEEYDNPEIILAEKSHGKKGKWTWPWSAIAPPTIYPGNAGQSGLTVTLNHVKKYEKRDGTPQTWNGGNDLQKKMSELDPRFKSCIVGNMMPWNNEFPTVEIYQGGRDCNTCYGGFWLHKHYPRILSDNPYEIIPNSTLFQLNEIYLNYAEAMNEAYGPDATEGELGMTAREAVNRIRSRSGMPPVAGAADKDSFREKVRHERDIELAFDNHRFWDIRRWMIAEQDGVMQGDMWGIKVYKIEGNDREYSYEPYVFEKRTFSRKHYLHPFSTNEINKGYLVQNPGY